VQMRRIEVSISVVKCSWVTCGEVLQCRDITSNKVSNIIRRHTDNRKLLPICVSYMYIAIMTFFHIL
jgi:hypothetical protein